MPFTFSHPAIVLPLQKLVGRWVSLTGLVVGSIVPDFEYFIRMRSEKGFSHTIPGVFLFDLPLGLLLCFLFHNVVRNSLFSHLPYFLNSRLSNFKRFNWNKYFIKNWYIVLISIIIGTASHLVWDAFTHENGFVFQIAGFFGKDINPDNPEVPEYKLLQVLSSVIGGAIVLYAILQMPEKDKVRRPVYYKYWFYIGLITMLIMAIRFYTAININEYREVVTNLISSILIALLLVSLALRREYYR